MNERGYLDLIIARIPELSFREKALLSETFGCESDFVCKSAADIESLIGRKLNTTANGCAFWNIDEYKRQAEQDVNAAKLRGINWVTLWNKDYPPLLREIYDPPLVLFYRGNLPNPQMPLAGIVGTRKPSPQAVAQAFDIARDLGRAGISVISGLAMGIDAMAHRGNIEGGASTVAVLGSGVDEVYPSVNRALARRILETGGAILSEYPPGTSPRKWNFPARNRIISGLSRGVLIVEAPQKSGALITAGFALEHNRELWVASAGTEAEGEKNVFDRRGTIKLAEDGAEIINSASCILKAWNISGNTQIFTDKTDIGEHEQLSEGRALASSLAQSLGVSL